MDIQVRFLGLYRDFSGTREGTYSLEPPVTVNDLIEHLVSKYPKFQPFRNDVRVLINGLGVAEDEKINPGDEVVLIDPISGG